MTKLFSILATLAFLAICTSAIPAPAPSHTVVAAKHIAANPEASPNVAQAKHNEYTMIEARQYRNADYGSDQGPTGNPQPQQASTTMSATSATAAPTSTTAGARRSIGKETEPQPQTTHAQPVDYTQEY